MVAFDDEREAYAAIMRGDVKAGDVLVVRYEGPSGRIAIDLAHDSCFTAQLRRALWTSPKA